jgi:hypothetical protein
MALIAYWTAQRHLPPALSCNGSSAKEQEQKPGKEKNPSNNLDFTPTPKAKQNRGQSN